MTDDKQIALGAWFPFYPGDFLRATSHLDGEEIGAYLLLLMHQWSEGSIPDDLDRLRRITRSSEAATVEVVSRYFPDGRNPRLEKERTRTLDKRQAAHDRGVKGAEARWNKDRASNAQALDDPLLEQYSPSPSPSPSPKPEPSPSPKEKPPKVSDVDWNSFKAMYPKRQGAQGWQQARSKADRLLAAGVEFEDIIKGADRYRRQQEHAGRIGTEFIKQATSFLTPQNQLWTEDYPLPSGNPSTQARVSTAQRWADGET